MRIGIDVDGVIADNHTAWLNRYNLLPGIRDGMHSGWTPNDLTQWEVWKDLGCTKDEIMSLYTPDMYEEVRPYPDALAAVKAIIALGHEVLYITSCFSANEWIAKHDWLVSHGFSMDRTDARGVGAWAEYKTKGAVAVGESIAWLIDDHVPNVESWPGYALLLTRPHNKALQCRCKRVKSLDEVVTLLRASQPADKVRVGDMYQVLKVEDLPEGGVATRERRIRSALPTDKQARKDTPITSGVLDYFSAAIAEVARVSKAGNDQHNPGQPLHWARGKSMDHADCVSRHLMERGTVDDDGQRHSAKLAWRALALLQQELEDEGAPMSRASKVSDDAA